MMICYEAILNYLKPLARKRRMEEIHLMGEDLQRKHAWSTVIEIL